MLHRIITASQKAPASRGTPTAMARTYLKEHPGFQMKDEIQRRVEAMRLAHHSNAMEWLREVREDAAVLDAYARGEKDGDEARRLIKARIARRISRPALPLPD